MPSPGIVTTVYFAIHTPQNPTFRYSRPLTLRSGEALCNQILHSLRDDQRLRHAAERRKCKVFLSPMDHAGGEIDVDLVARNESFLLRVNLFGELLTESLNQLRYFHAEKSIVICIPQVSLREAARNHDRNAPGFEARHGLLAA